MSSKIISPFNRVEGDLDLKIEFSGNTVVKAYAISRLFRGIEIILKEKYPMDALVITPRVCGICGGSHLLASAQALDMAYKAEVPENGVRLRNVMSMAEMGQNDARHIYLMFLIDTVNRKYEKFPFYKDMVMRWAPFYGSSYKAAVVWSKRYTEIYAIFGGQWPHGSSIVPGGITCEPTPEDIIKAKAILKTIKENFIEKVLLGGPLTQFLELKSQSDLDQWSEDYPQGDISKIWIYGKEMEWDKLGSGSQYLMSFGHLPLAENYSQGKGELRFRSGILNLKTWEIFPLEQGNIAEFVTHSFYTYTKGNVGLHPFKGETIPIMPKENGKYTFTKAFRYSLNGEYIAPEVGSLAMLSVSLNPLIVDILRRRGKSVLVREISRILRLVLIHKFVEEELGNYEPNGKTYIKPDEKNEGEGFGLVEASRGSLGHWISIKDGKINNYQIITPTQINMGPEDPFGNPSHMSQALVGTKVDYTDNPIEIVHIVRSHDACMVCNVHFLDGNQERFSVRI
ncbi:cytochrome B [Candidatus Acidianus copahuensis]|uniref:Cytochrome B n=1 Tax=Candidatus Acidianus copahuensis TaxID=1160895 RepID=A0A031LIL1_9CREN|nr:nickel-dependent hydrogenase large subunit [Candidatus Acidianus copahuensis]EZQ01972.1 cytochrome B [Candidatus Acidianus copahuensis]